jgi:TPR repeat protein
MKSHQVVGIAAVLLAGCAGLNPNPGERTADVAWEHGDYARALSVIRPRAEDGEPWAQLRLGVAYELGRGVPKDPQQAVHWYQRVAVQETTGGWAEGKIIGAVGRAGYFNQTSDALIAQYQLAGLYLQGEDTPRDLRRAYLLARNVTEKSGGHDIFFCCEWSGGLYITGEMIAQRLRAVEDAMTPEERRAAEAAFSAWTPQDAF